MRKTNDTIENQTMQGDPKLKTETSRRKKK